MPKLHMIPPEVRHLIRRATIKTSISRVAEAVGVSPGVIANSYSQFWEVRSTSATKIYQKLDVIKMMSMGHEIKDGVKAMLVDVSLRTRILVPEHCDTKTPEGLKVALDLAKPKFVAIVNNELGDNLEDIYPDEEVPFDPETG